MSRIVFDALTGETKLVAEVEILDNAGVQQPVQLTTQEELDILKQRQDATENTVLYLLDLNLTGGA